MLHRRFQEFWGYIFKAATCFTILIVWRNVLYGRNNATNTDVQGVPHQSVLRGYLQSQKDSTFIMPTDSKTKISNKQLQLEYSPMVNGIKASMANFYIIQEGYTSRLKPDNFSSPKDSLYQISAYYAAGELARRYNARYLVDVGCGTGSKLHLYKSEFNLIGIDFKANLETIWESHPYIHVIEMDLDQGSNCLVDLPVEILSQAVVISADVIEHLVNPFHCYIKLIQEFSRHAMAVVVSSPDRYKLCKESECINGPPYDTEHVREWLVQELEIMFMDYGMFPVACGWVCAEGGKCGEGIIPETNQYTTSVVIMANTQVRSRWLEQPVVSSQVFAFLIVTEDVNDILVDFNLQYLTSQGIQVCLLVVGSWQDMQNRDVPIMNAVDMNHAAHIIEIIVNMGEFNPEDWIIIQSAHEVVSLPQSSALNISLHDTLLRVGKEPYGFNAVASSTFFTHATDGTLYPNGTLKMFGLHSWNPEGEYSLDNLKPAVDTLKDRVRIWKHGNYNVSLTTSETLHGQFAITDVHFLGRHVYPYHAQSIRFHPSFNAPYVWLESDIRRMYILESTLGYYEANGQLVVNHYPY